MSITSFQNAFSKLAKFGFNLYLMLVVDFMHEFELNKACGRACGRVYSRTSYAS